MTARGARAAARAARAVAASSLETPERGQVLEKPEAGPALETRQAAAPADELRELRELRARALQARRNDLATSDYQHCLDCYRRGWRAAVRHILGD